MSNNNNRGNTVTIEQRQRQVAAKINKAHKEADQLREMAHQCLERMAAEADHKRNNSFWAAISIFSFLLLVLAGAGVAMVAGG